MTATEFTTSLYYPTDMETVRSEFPDLNTIILSVGSTDSGIVYPRYNMTEGPFTGGCYAGRLDRHTGPWVADGYDIRITKDLVTYISGHQHDYHELNGVIKPYRNLRTHVADFYLLEALMHLVPFNRINESIVTKLGYGNIAVLLKDFSPAERVMLLKNSDMYSEQDNFCMEVALFFTDFVERFGRILYEYCFYAIAGELRHCPVQNILTGHTRTAYEIMRRLRETLGPNGDRMVLEWARKAFKPKTKGGMWKWEDAYGGTAWARCTDIVLQYRTGKLSKQLFVDRICTVQHNTGSFLNKGNLFNCDGLHHVLNAHHNSDFKALLRYSSPEVTDLYVRAGTVYNELHLLPKYLQPGTAEADLYGLQTLAKKFISK